MGGVAAFPAHVPQLYGSKAAIAGFREYDIGRHGLFYFGHQIFQDKGFHLHTRVHYITVHNVSVLNISKIYRSNHGEKTLKASL
jgi:hypothetical protein